MQQIDDPSLLASWHGACFVPTMGALHEGHGSLIRLASSTGRPTVVSIFVNPTQFGPGEDFDRYPRTLEADLAIAKSCGAAACWTPSVADLYPRGAEAARAEAEAMTLPAVATAPGLEDRCRPGHFAGVAQVVARLFDLLRPSAAVFGEKDFQQLRLIESMVEEDAASTSPRWPGLSIVRGATIREPDGLAMSSRNRYLDADSRERSRGLSRALQVAHAAQHPETAERLMRETLEHHGLEIEYAAVRDAETLMPVADLRRPTRALIAARLPMVRLIDNAALVAWR
jgi:pantoate--beta-alanine ligase